MDNVSLKNQATHAQLELVVQAVGVLVSEALQLLREYRAWMGGELLTPAGVLDLICELEDQGVQAEPSEGERSANERYAGLGLESLLTSLP